MAILLIKRALFGRKKKKKHPPELKLKRGRAEQVNETLPVSTQRRIPEWEDVLTSSLRENCLAPADEVILHAFDLYCDELNKPVHERRRRMAGLFSEVTTEFAQLQSLAPDMVERAAAKHRLELNHFTDSKGAF
ncbi:hypothetical protein [Ruegeria sp. HKCCD8929]|uniref:hypothetical protein n=1 Tax=Ruegeria sp. HKCCD8929 TaxID=2683006 RepID=UPI001487D8C4|nr:hypothetical protein [Ruegeria sp. HKCCD8929]